MRGMSCTADDKYDSSLFFENLIPLFLKNLPKRDKNFQDPRNILNILI